MVKYIYQNDSWPCFTWDEQRLQALLGRVRHLQGKLLGQMNAIGIARREETVLSTLTLDVLKSSEIEGEMLNYNHVRSSIARKLGMEYAGMVYPDRNVEGVVEMMLDATQNYMQPLDEDRLFGWMLLCSLRAGAECTRLRLAVTAPGRCRSSLGPWARRRFTMRLRNRDVCKLKWSSFYYGSMESRRWIR